MTLKIGRHFYLIAPNRIARNLFLCRLCNIKCEPQEFRPYRKNKDVPVYIATSYICKSCNESFITNEVLNRQQRPTVRSNYNSLTDN